MVVLFSCSEKDDDDRIRAINESLVKSNKIIEYNTYIAHYELESRCTDPQYAEKAVPLFYVADSVKNETEKLLKYIDGLMEAVTDEDNTSLHIGDDIFKKQGKGIELYNKIDEYKKRMQRLALAIKKGAEGARIKTNYYTSVAGGCCGSVGTGVWVCSFQCAVFS